MVKLNGYNANVCGNISCCHFILQNFLCITSHLHKQNAQAYKTKNSYSNHVSCLEKDKSCSIRCLQININTW